MRLFNVAERGSDREIIDAGGRRAVECPDCRARGKVKRSVPVYSPPAPGYPKGRVLFHRSVEDRCDTCGGSGIIRWESISPPPSLPVQTDEIRLPGPRADYALRRRDDPETSVPPEPERIPERQAAVWRFLAGIEDREERFDGDGTPEVGGWVAAYIAAGVEPTQSASGLRTRRDELAEAGLVVSDGKTRNGRGRLVQTWRAVGAVAVTA